MKRSHYLSYLATLGLGGVLLSSCYSGNSNEREESRINRTSQVVTRYDNEKKDHVKPENKDERKVLSSGLTEKSKFEKSIQNPVPKDDKTKKLEKKVESASDRFSFKYKVVIEGQDYMNEFEKINQKEKLKIYSKIDFYPHDLVYFDLKESDKLIAENIKSDNVSSFRFGYIPGINNYSVLVNRPIQSKESINFKFEVLSTLKLVNLILESDHRDKFDLPNLEVINYGEGYYPRHFIFRLPKDENVSYEVKGLDSLIDIRHIDLVSYFRNRKSFKDLKEFRDYINKYNNSNLKIIDKNISIEEKPKKIEPEKTEVKKKTGLKSKSSYIDYLKSHIDLLKKQFK